MQHHVLLNDLTFKHFGSLYMIRSTHARSRYPLLIALSRRELYERLQRGLLAHLSSSSADVGLCSVTRSRRRRNGRSTTMCSSNAAEKHVTA
jgi:hypothetical protein